MLQGLQKWIGAQDAVLIAGPEGQVIFSKNPEKQLIPASTLKILTGLFALETLGPDYRFETGFYLDTDLNLTIKGYGDPLLISEVVKEIAEALRLHVKQIKNLVLDDSFFAQPLVIPGVTASTQPYDAPNGALCVNFNTVYFKRTPEGGYESAEPQTPLLPFVLNKIKTSNLKRGRIIFSQEQNEITQYAGHLFEHYLKEAGVKVNGTIRLGAVRNGTDRLIYRHRSPFTLAQSVSKLLEHSNNFTANQLLISTGAKVFGPPGTLGKGVRAAARFAADRLGIDTLEIVEGSGISRQNRISADTMLKILTAFRPYHPLMQHDSGEFYKTGTLFGVSTRAGYLEGNGGALHPFVVFFNSTGKSAEQLMPHLFRLLKAR